jgi:excisionase family DNA binding protein
MRFYLVAEIAEMLRLSQSQVFALIRAGKLKAHRFSCKKQGALRVSQEQLDEYLRETESAAEAAPRKALTFTHSASRRPSEPRP